MECSKCNNYGHLVKYCQIEERSNDLCGIALYAQNGEDKWYINNGHTKDMSRHEEKFITLKREKGGDVSFGDDGTTKITGKGTMALRGGAKAQNVLYVKGLK